MEEHNYATHNKEMLVIVIVLKKWEPILTGTRFEILTDHAPLTHIKTQHDLSPGQIRWNEFLLHFNTDIQYIPGVSNSAADALSHVPHPAPSTPVELPQLKSDCLSLNQAGPDQKLSNNPLSPLDPALDSART